MVQIETCELDGGHRSVVLNEPTLWSSAGVSRLAWLADGRVIYAARPSPSDSTYDVLAIAVNPDNGEKIGPPHVLTNSEQSPPDDLSVSADGKQLIYDSHRDDDVLFLADVTASGKPFNPRRATTDEWDTYPGDWTRDSGAFFFYSARGGKLVVGKTAPASGASEVLLSGEANYSYPILSPDGTRLLFTEKSNPPNPVTRLMSMPVGGGARSAIASGRYRYNCGRSPSAGCVMEELQGKQLVFSVLDPVKGKGNEIQRVDCCTNATWALSPDGAKVAIAPDEQEKWVLVLSIADHKVTELPHSGTWNDVQHVTWAPDGNHLFATAWSDPTAQFQSILYIDQQGNFKPLYQVKQGAGWLQRMEASPDGRSLAYTERIYAANVTMLENF